MSTRAVGGEVAVTGPGHMHGAFRPGAARESAKRLIDAADAADSQDSEDIEPLP